jgi:pyruvate formate lyase activating enzyme
VLLGLQKTSLVDFPGRVSAVLFTAGCALRCPYCHNPGLVEPTDVDLAGLITVDEALAFLKRRLGLMTGVVLSGGEPTLHGDMPELAAAIRSLGFKVKLDTNGTCSERVAPVRADYVAMDIKTAPERYAELWPDAPADAADRVRRGAEAVRASGAEYEFRITCAPGIFAEADAEAVAEMLRPEDPVFLQRYRPGRVLDPGWAAGVSPYAEDRLAGLLAIIARAAPKARLRGL